MTVEIALGLLALVVAVLGFLARDRFTDFKDDIKALKKDVAILQAEVRDIPILKGQLDQLRLQMPLVVTDQRLREALKGSEDKTSALFDKLREDMPGIVRLAIIDHTPPSQAAQRS